MDTARCTNISILEELRLTTCFLLLWTHCSPNLELKLERLMVTGKADGRRNRGRSPVPNITGVRNVGVRSSPNIAGQ